MNNIDVEDVLAALEADRAAGVLPELVATSAVRYGVDPEQPDQLVAVDAEGKRINE